MLIIISAMTKDRIIGNSTGDGMPWNVPDEYNKFLAFVQNQAIVMGRTSYEIFKGDLSSSEVFVVSRSPTEVAGATVCGSIEEAIKKAEATKKDVYISGGGQIYKLGIPYAERMYLSIIKGDFSGSVFFPEFDESEWTITKREDHPEFDFFVYERIVESR